MTPGVLDILTARLRLWLVWQGKLDEAIEFFKKAIAIGEHTLGKEPPDVAIRW